MNHLMDYSYPIWKPGGWYEQVSQDNFTSLQVGSDVQKHLGETMSIGNFSQPYVWCCNKTGSSKALATVSCLPPGYAPVCYAYTRAQMQDLCAYRGPSTEVYSASTGLYTVSLRDDSNTEECAETYTTNDTSQADAYATVWMKAVEAENGSSDDEPSGAA
jgi:hypothetical protein